MSDWSESYIRQATQRLARIPSVEQGPRSMTPADHIAAARVLALMAIAEAMHEADQERH